MFYIIYLTAANPSAIIILFVEVARIFLAWLCRGQQPIISIGVLCPLPPPTPPHPFLQPVHNQRQDLAQRKKNNSRKLQLVCHSKVVKWKVLLMRTCAEWKGNSSYCKLEYFRGKLSEKRRNMAPRIVASFFGGHCFVNPQVTQ